jgi:hypothetical protein
MQIAPSRPRPPELTGLFGLPRTKQPSQVLAGPVVGSDMPSTVATNLVDTRSGFLGASADRMQIASPGAGAYDKDISTFVEYVNQDRPQTTLSGLAISTDQPLPGSVRRFAAKHQLTASVAVALQTIKRLFPALPVEISLESDTETGETVILFTSAPPASQDLDDLSEMNSRLHDAVFNSLPTKSLQFLSFGFRFD